MYVLWLNYMQAVLEDSMTKGAASEKIKQLSDQQTMETATPKQIANLKEAMPHAPISQLNSMSTEQASRLISAYFKLQSAKKSQSKKNDSPRKDNSGDSDDGANDGAATAN